MDKGLYSKYRKHIISILNFFVRNGVRVKPFPKITLNETHQEDDVFGKTGYYDFNGREIVLFTDGRFFKDVLRSLCHELIHHRQNLCGRIDPDMIEGTDIIGEDDKVKYLEKLEKDAFLNGNIMFRRWTETEKKRKRGDE